MSRTGTIGWIDLTVEDAATVRDFYAAVVGWTPAAVSLGDYDDYTMNAPVTGDPVAGVCHARGSNADLPPVWLPYFVVADLGASVEACTARGGAVLVGPRQLGSDGPFCVIRDPAGAVAALFEETGPVPAP